MASKNELIEIKMRLLGAKQVAEESGVASKGVKGVGEAASFTGTMSLRTARKTSLLTRAYSGLKTAAKTAFGVLAVGGAFALRSAINKTAELSKATTGLVRNLGFHTNVASRWAAVAQSRGIDTKALGQSFAILSSKMVEANRKGGSLLTPFRQLGLTQKDVAKGAHDANWGIMRVAKALGEAHGSAKRMTAMKAVLGKGWATMGPLFSNPKELKEQLHWADKYGVTLDTKTNSSIMRMVKAQRESKVAMAGLEVQAAKGLMPTIVGVNKEFQKFVATLNDKRLTGDQKIALIGKQFEHLEDTLIQVVTAALPKVAESGGTLGVKLAGAIVKGFLHAGIWGKLVITAWLLRFMGGGGLIRGVAGRAGRRMALALARVFVPTLAAEFAITGSVGLMLKGRLAALQPIFTRWGGRFGWALVIGLVTFGLADSHTRNSLVKYGNILGGWIVHGLTWVVNKGIDGINWGFDKANVFAFLGVKAPHMGHIDNSFWEMGGIGGQASGVLGNAGNWPEEHGHHHGRKKGGGRNHSSEKEDHAKRPAPGPRRKFGSFESGGSGKKTVVLQLNVDGKVLAQRTLNHAEAAAALA